MIYGKDSKGNYPLLSKVAKISPVFPAVDNKRSVLYIENLCEFVRLVIINNDKGIFYPQNKEYISTSKLVEMIANVNGKKILIIKGFGWMIRLLSKKGSLFLKAFGNFQYHLQMSEYRSDYRVVSFKESIEKTEL